MTDDMNGLDDLSQLWTSENSPATSPATNNFENRFKVARLKMIVLVAIESMIAVAAFATGVYKITQGSLILGGSILIFSLVSLGIAFWSRSGAWSVLTGSVKDELIASIKQTRAQYRWAWGGIWISAFALIFLAILIYSRELNPVHNAADSHQFFLGFSIALVFIAINLIITSFLLEKSRRRLFKLRLLHKQLNESDR